MRRVQDVGRGLGGSGERGQQRGELGRGVGRQVPSAGHAGERVRHRAAGVRRHGTQCGLAVGPGGGDLAELLAGHVAVVELQADRGGERSGTVLVAEAQPDPVLGVGGQPESFGFPRGSLAESSAARALPGHRRGRAAQLERGQREPLQDPRVVAGGVLLDGAEETAVQAVEATSEPGVLRWQLDPGTADRVHDVLLAPVPDHFLRAAPVADRAVADDRGAAGRGVRGPDPVAHPGVAGEAEALRGVVL